MDLIKLMRECHQTARSKGWWRDAELPGASAAEVHLAPLDQAKVHKIVPEKLLLMHSEISEAVEEYRSGNNLGTISYGPEGKPLGYLTELADVLIRQLDLIKAQGLEEQFIRALAEKMEFNKTREFRHGNKVA